MQLFIGFVAGAALVGLFAFWKINQLKLETVRLQEREGFAFQAARYPQERSGTGMGGNQVRHARPEHQAHDG